MRISDWSSDVCSSDLYQLQYAQVAVGLDGSAFLRITSTESSVTKLASTLNLSVKPKCHMFWACSVSLLRRYLRKRFSTFFTCNMTDGSGLHRRFQASSTSERKTLALSSATSSTLRLCTHQQSCQVS